MITSALLRALAAGLIMAAAPVSSSANIEPRQQQGGPGRPWVSVDSQGEAHTFTRHVTTINGATSTVDAQPYSLTGSVYTYIATNGATTTRTGNPPPPRATDSSGGKGYFIQCLDASNSPIHPFCQPRNGARLYVNVPYYITWDRNLFGGDLDTPAQIQGFTRNSVAAPIGDDETPLSKGYYIWRPTEALLNGNDQLNLTLRIAFNSSLTNEMTYYTGATISLRPENQQPREVPAAGGGGGVPVAAIVVPIVIVVLIAAAISAFFLIRKRRRSQAATVTAVPDRGSSAFGVRGSAQYNQKSNQDIELTTSPTSPRGGNVFQEEIERQNRERAM